MLTYSRMPSYLRFTPPTLEVSSVRPRLIPFQLACPGTSSRSRKVGTGLTVLVARTRDELDEIRPAPGAADGRPEVRGSRGLPCHRRAAPRARPRQHEHVPGRAAAAGRLHGRVPDRSGAHQKRRLGGERRASGDHSHAGVVVPAVSPRNVSARRRVTYSVSSSRMPAVVFGWTKAMRRPPAPLRGTSSMRRKPAA